MPSTIDCQRGATTHKQAGSAGLTRILITDLSARCGTPVEVDRRLRHRPREFGKARHYAVVSRGVMLRRMLIDCGPSIPFLPTLYDALVFLLTDLGISQKFFQCAQ